MRLLQKPKPPGRTASLVGVVVGLAAQRSIGALFIQLSISQPIRIGDKVVVEGESGTVAEISLTNVVLGLWDHRNWCCLSVTS